MRLKLPFANERCSEQEHHRKETTLASIGSAGLPARKGAKPQTIRGPLHIRGQTGRTEPRNMKTLSSAGSLVGLWSPGFSSAFSVAGYHFHFLSEDRKEGGHLLECESGRLRLRMEALTDFHVALPETENFLKADLSKSTADELAYAESAH